MAITPNDFDKIWSTNASTPAYTFSDADYLEGWDFVGNLPPTRAQWNAIQKRTDEKMKYVFDNFGAPLVANTVADMTEQNRVYVYTGSEVGYTAGHWYYWDGNAWADGGVYNAVVVATDTTLTQAGVPADAEATGDAIATLTQTTNEEIGDVAENVSYIKNGRKLDDIVASENHILAVGYSLANNGMVGSTSNLRYFACTYNYLPISRCQKLVFRCDPTYAQRLYYAFFDADKVLIGNREQINVTQREYEIAMPTGAKYVNVGGYGTGVSNAVIAVQTTLFLGDASFFYGLLDTTLTSETLPAQGKAVGDVFDTTGLKRLRITPNSNNINFAVKTGLTNLYIGYGAGGDNTEDTQGETLPEHDNGKYNTALGVEAFRNNVDGDHCTAIGFTCLKYNVSGDFNTCVGEDALFSNTTGSNNIAMGDHAGQNNNGSNNIILGARVMRNATNSSGNIILGKEAGSVLDTGGNNIIIGNSLNPSTDSSNNIMIGTSSHTKVVIAGKLLTFNNDGTVTWTSI